MEIMKIFQQCFFIILVEMIKNETFLYSFMVLITVWNVGVLFSRVLGLFIGGSYHSLSEEKNWNKILLENFLFLFVWHNKSSLDKFRLKSIKKVKSFWVYRENSAKIFYCTMKMTVTFFCYKFFIVISEKTSNGGR